MFDVGVVADGLFDGDSRSRLLFLTVDIDDYESQRAVLRDGLHRRKTEDFFENSAIVCSLLLLIGGIIKELDRNRVWKTHTGFPA